MPDIALRVIAQHNWRDAIVLEVAEDQQGFVTSNLFSVAQAAYDPNLFAVAIYDRSLAQMVGFVLYGFLEFSDYQMWYIARFMIDQHQQGKGYGRSALSAIIRRLRNRHGADSIMITVVPENHRAKQFYAGIGFTPEDAQWDNEDVMILRLDSKQ